MAKKAEATLVSPDQIATLEAALTSGSTKSKYRPGPPCGVAKILASLPAPTAAKVLQEIDNEENSLAALAEMLMSAGFEVSPFTVGRHRRRGTYNGCRCAA